MVHVLVASAIAIAGASEALACAGDDRGLPPTTPQPPSAEAQSLHGEAAAAEKAGKNRDAVLLYVKAAKAGSGDAAARLGDVYDKGLLGEARDYFEASKWFNLARTRGALPPSSCR